MPWNRKRRSFLLCIFTMDWIVWVMVAVGTWEGKNSLQAGLLKNVLVASSPRPVCTLFVNTLMMYTWFYCLYHFRSVRSDEKERNSLLPVADRIWTMGVRACFVSSKSRLMSQDKRDVDLTILGIHPALTSRGILCLLPVTSLLLKGTVGRLLWRARPQGLEQMTESSCAPT